MKKIFAILITTVMILVTIMTLISCGAEKNITVIVREDSSGTREAFDKVITKDGQILYGNISQEAVMYNKTGLVLSAVANDDNAIGYISLGSVDDTVNVVKVNGVTPSDETVLDGSYEIQRPFVIMTTSKTSLTLRADDFMKYLKSAEASAHCDAAGTIFLDDATKRANNEAAPINVGSYEKLSSIPDGEKIIIRGSTSMEKLINSAAKGYAELYGVNVEDIFDIELQGSSVGRSAVENDTAGNVIGLSSATVNKEGIDSFNICLDAVAVIVNKNNTQVNDLTVEQLYDIFSGEIKKFSDLQ